MAKTSTPTPMGDVFRDTDIHHLGYCLGRNSVPLCEHVDTANVELDWQCLIGNKTNKEKYMWDVRDFNVDVDIVSSFVSTFVLQNNTLCNEMQKRSKGNKFILYNAFCTNTTNASESEYSPRQYYQPQCEF